MYPVSIPGVEVNKDFTPQQTRYGDHEVTFIVSPVDASQNWIMRVEVGDQYIVVFPKFETYAIGFQGSSDGWDLPYDCTVEEIWWMIKADKKFSTPKAECILAIKLLKSILEAHHE